MVGPLELLSLAPFGLPPLPAPIMEVMAAAKAAVKFGSVVRAFTVSANEPCAGSSCGGGGTCWPNWLTFGDIWRPENFDWL